MSGWAVYEAWVGVQTAEHQAGVTYSRAVEAHGPDLDADSPEVMAAEEASHDAEVAWRDYYIAQGVDPDPLATREAEAEALDQESRGAAWEGPFPGTATWYADLYGPEAAGLGPAERASEPEPEAGG